MITEPALRAERELRLAAERLLLTNTGRHRGRTGTTSLGEVASALVVLADLPLATAEAVLEQYSAASSLRGIGPPPHFRQIRQQTKRQPAPPPLTLPVVYALDTTYQGGHVRSVFLCGDQVRISASYDGSPPWMAGTSPWPPRRRSAGPGPMPGQPPTLTVTDDQGASSTAHFNGGGNEGGWTGSWVTQQPLSATTGWIELDGTRIMLTQPVRPAKVRIEQLPTAPPTHRFLWQRLALDAPHGDLSDEVLDVLVRTGLLDPDDNDDAAALEALSQVAEARTGHARLRTPNEQVPAAWRDLLTGRQHSGPVGTIPIAAVTPAFDGVQALVYQLQSDPEGFSLEATATGVSAQRHPMFDEAVTSNSLAWWAADDRGNNYLGHWASHSSSHAEVSGTVYFDRALDPKATSLVLQPTSLRARAVITVELPAWSSR